MYRRCIVVGCPYEAERNKSRCRTHRLVYPAGERKRMADTVAAWRQVRGDWCPGYEVPPHRTSDLTAEHVVPRSRGGVGGPLVVLCRACNARRGVRD